MPTALLNQFTFSAGVILHEKSLKPAAFLSGHVSIQVIDRPIFIDSKRKVKYVIVLHQNTSCYTVVLYAVEYLKP